MESSPRREPNRGQDAVHLPTEQLKEEKVGEIV